MTINLNLELIDKFRDKVNERSIFSDKYINIENKNKWNLICSAMDWITITVEGLPLINLKGTSKGPGYDSLQSLNLVQYIISIDILVQSIIQLYRVLYESTTYSLENDKSIFNQEKISDDTYFKHIRAIFGAHPVNLTSLDGVAQKKGERFFASWVTEDHLGDKDFSVFLYSNDPNDDEDHSFEISINEINSYAEKRYNLLFDLTNKVDLILNDHEITYRKKQILSGKDDLSQLRILHEENKKRFGTSEGYAYLINYIYRILKVNLNKDLNFDTTFVDDYRNYLASIINIIKTNLQNMKYDYIPLGRDFKGYEFEKISVYLHTGTHAIGEEYFYNLIRVGILPTYLLDCEDMIEKELFFDAMIYKANKISSLPVKYKDLIELFSIK
ncbi:hypothetical protein ACNHOZ_27715 [Priestia sp. D51]